MTAVLVRGKDISSSYQIYQQINAGPRAQAALPGAVLTSFIDLLGQGQQVLTLVAYVALAMAVLSAALSLYSATLQQLRDVAVMRALGASRTTVLWVALYEAMLQGLAGILAGFVIAHGIAAILAWQINQRSGIGVAPGLEPSELLIICAIFVLGTLTGVLPALRAYRVEAAGLLAV